jgi:hypothetical protein
MPNKFSPARLSQWCGLYARFIERDGHRLAGLVSQCPSGRIQQYLLNVDENQLASLLDMEKTMDEDCLTAYGLLKNFDTVYPGSHFQPLNPPPVTTLADGRRYLLASKNESPILRAIPACKRFKPDHALGDQGILGLKHEWRALEDSTAIDYAASVALDFLLEPTRRFVRIGLSPVAAKDDMEWVCDPSDRRGEVGSTPFWCHGAKDESELLGRLHKALALAREKAVDILIFPELVITEALQACIAETLLRQAFDPAHTIRLVVAGTRHVHENGSFSNRCTVLNHLGEEEWTQDKRQRFNLSAAQAQRLFGPTCPEAFEPTKTGNGLSLRKTALGLVASPICLDFIQDPAWADMPVQVFLVPAMSDGLSRFEDRCRALGGKGAAAFVCNASLKDPHVAYRPSRQELKLIPQDDLLFTTDVDIEMNED